jgi:hypothetical protein
VKNSKEHGVKFAAHVKKLKKSSYPPEMDDPVEILIYSQLVWESTSSKADEAWSWLAEEALDWHELRVSTPAEIAQMCRDTSELALERGKRLKMMLNHLYQRHHEVTMAPEFEHGKRDLRESIESLDGMTPFVAARWLLLCGDIGDVPIDDQLCWMLSNAECVDESATLIEVATWVGRQVKSDQALDVHATLQAWVNGQSDAVSKKRAKAVQTAVRAAKRVRAKALADRAEAQKIAKEKKAEAARRAAAKKAAAEQAAIEAEQRAAARQAAAAAKKAAPKKKAPAKKKVTKKAVSKKKVPKKKPSTKKKVTKKKPSAKKKVTKKKVTKKKTAKKPASKKKRSTSRAR